MSDGSKYAIKCSALASTFPLQARQSYDFARCMVGGYLHVKRRAGVSEVFGGEHSALLADQESGRVSVAADVVLQLNV
jgi:hypothetical protein